MANFYAFPGIWVKVIKQFGTVNEGQILQVISASNRWENRVTFVGEHSVLSVKYPGQYIEPWGNKETK